MVMLDEAPQMPYLIVCMDHTSTMPPASPHRPARKPPRQRRRPLARLAVVALLAATLTGCDAAWGPLESYYNKQVRVEGSGLYYPEGAAKAASGMIVADRANDGNSVYGRTVFFFWEHDPYCGCMTYKRKSSKSTAEWSNKTKAETLTQALSATSSISRGEMFVCAQMGWPVPDNCSNSAFVSFNY